MKGRNKGRDGKRNRLSRTETNELDQKRVRRKLLNERAASAKLSQPKAVPTSAPHRTLEGVLTTPD
jgi:hypothetical protein